jgi:hypothetical protein
LNFLSVRDLLLNRRILDEVGVHLEYLRGGSAPAYHLDLSKDFDFLVAFFQAL